MAALGMSFRPFRPGRENLPPPYAWSHATLDQKNETMRVLYLLLPV
jgi:hypothetical protein